MRPDQKEIKSPYYCTETTLSLWHICGEREEKVSDLLLPIIFTLGLAATRENSRGKTLAAWLLDAARSEVSEESGV